MADSFFGFDTSLSNVNELDDGGGREASEDEYDALNDETFGLSADDGDWEQQHEELSMLQERDKNHSDLEAYLSHLMLEEYEDFSPKADSPQFRNNANKQHQTPKYQPQPQQHQQIMSTPKSAPLQIPSSHTSQHSNHLPQQSQQPLPTQVPQPQGQQSALHALTNIAQAPLSSSWMKNALSVEELERNIIRQAQQQKTTTQQNQQQSYPGMNQQQPQHMQQQQPVNQMNISQQQFNMLLPPQLQQQHMLSQKQVQQQQPQLSMQQQQQSQLSMQQPQMPMQQQQQPQLSMQQQQQPSQLPMQQPQLPMQQQPQLPMQQQQQPQLSMQQQPQMQQHSGMPMVLPFFQPRFPNNIVPPGPPPSLLGPRPQYNMSAPPPPIHPYGNVNQQNMPVNKMPMGVLQRTPNTVTNLQTLEKQQQMNSMNHPPPPHMQMNNLQQPINQQQFNNPPPQLNNIQQHPNVANMQQHVNNQQQQQNNMINQQNQPLASLIQSINNANQQNKANQQNINGTQLNHQPMNMLNQQQIQQQQGNLMNQKNIQMNKLNQQQLQQPFKVHQLQQNNNMQQNQQQQINNQQQQKKQETRVFSQKEVMQFIQETHPLLQKINMSKPMYRRKMEESIANAINQNSQKGEVDQYSGLMTQRQKQWLLNIQLMQLNTGTPYIDDYYYTVFLERQAKKEKNEPKEAHKANQQNHPFSQHNLSNNRYGNNSNNSEGGRERRNSSRSISDNNTNKDGPKTYVPTQFENSLGKLQCGSVTAPRKIIDMEVVASETGGAETNGTTPNTATSSRGSRLTLLTIESLYRILLRVEDLSEPMAIATALILKEREEKAKALFLEQQQNALDDEEPCSPPASEPANHFLRGIESVVKQQQSKESTGTSSASTSLSLSAPNLLDENKTDLLGKLMTSLLYEDRLNHILLFRKGKTLVVRILNQATPIEWWRAPLGRLWPRLLRCLPSCCRRDAQCLYPITTHFRNYLNGTEGWAPVSDLCQVLTEGAQQGLSFTVIRASTPALQHRGLITYMLSTQLGLSLLVILFERAAMLSRPIPAAWTALVRAAAKQALQAPTATAVTSRPTLPLPPDTLTTHATHANLSSQEKEALSELIC